ncbi:MAG: hypothetical protein P9L92_01630 [Candidatus Electryonea clarkiae]|nr:hypothetical protein [Candidatus Electryonea clarkiae]MDP8289026.1 hypothetical protein [Candidatus Electryonea clarkiae]
MNTGIQIKEVENKRQEKDFLDVPYIVQGSNPVWVPPLRVQVKELIDPKKNPFFDHAEMRKFVVYSDGRPAGRIAAINDSAHNSTHNETTTQFGFFECIDDEDAAKALFDSVEKSAGEWNHNLVRGPFNPSVNEDLGIQIDAFDRSPMVMLPYNPSWYPVLIDKCGFEKAMDLYCYYFDDQMITEKLIRGAELVRKRTKLKFRKFDKKHFWRDALKIWDVYRKAWEDNWCAVPFAEDEFRHMAHNLKQIADFDIIFLAEKDDGELVGFLLALPNINETVIKIRDGRLFPFGLPRLMWHTRKGAITSVRIPLMGVLEEYRGRGIDAVFYHDLFIEGVKKGYTWSEMSWILETNTMMNRAAEMMGGKRYKTYRIYEKVL